MARKEQKMSRFLMNSVASLFVCLFFTTSSHAQAKELYFNTQEFAPFHYTEKDKVTGPVPEIVSAACKEINVKCHFQSLPWPRAQYEAKLGKVNGLFVLGMNTERKKWLHFSPPVVTSEYGFFVHKSNPLNYLKPTDVGGYLIGVFGPSNTESSLREIVKKVGSAKIEVTPDDESGFKKLQRKRVQAVYSNRQVGEHIIKKMNLKDIRYAGVQRKVLYYIGFPKEYADKATIDRFNKALDRMYSDGEIEKILEKHNIGGYSRK